MSLDELNQRIKDEVVLREGDLFEWQWRQLGLVAEAEALGVSPGEFLTLVNEVSRTVNPYFGRISDLKIKVTDLARLTRKKLTDGQINQIVAEATRLQLLPDFVKDRWIPAILSAIPDPVEPPEGPVMVASQPVPVRAPDQPQLAPVSPPQPANAQPPAPAAGIDRAAVTRKVHQFLDEYVADKHIPARVLKPLFLATNFDETILAEAVLTYLSANFYAAETPTQGETLTDKLLSTDWRHLSWWAPVQAIPIATIPVVRPVQRGSSDVSVIGMALVAVALLIGAVWWVTAEKPAKTVKILPPQVQPADSVPATRLKKKTRRKSRVAPQQTRSVQP